MNWLLIPLMFIMLSPSVEGSCLPSVVLNAQPRTMVDLLQADEGVLSSVPGDFVGNSRVALLQDVEAQSLLQLTSCRSDTQFAIMVWHCLPCSSAANGNLPTTLLSSGWDTERCAALLPDGHPMRTFTTTVNSQDGPAFIPIETFASIVAVFELWQPLPVGWCPRFVGPTGSAPSVCPMCVLTDPPAPVPVPQPGTPSAPAPAPVQKQQFPGSSARQAPPARETHAPPTPFPPTDAPATLPPPTPSPHEATLPNGLRAYYPFDGNANDVSGNNRHGSVSGAVLSTDRFGQPNSAYYFNGVNSIINLGTAGFTNMDRFSVSAWVNLAGDPSVLGAIVSCRRTPSAEAFSLEVTKDGLPRTEYIYAFEWERWVTGPARLEIGQWTHIATVMDTTGVSFYVDGVEVSRNNGGGSLKSEHTQNTAIGARSDGQFHHFHGMIDEVRIWDRALTPEEVMAARGEMMVTLGLIGDYPFTSNADDISGQDNHGMVNGATPANGRDGSAAGAYSFSSTDSISIGEAFSTPYFTAAVWVSLSQYTPNTQFVTSKRAATVGYSIGVDAAGKLFVDLTLDGITTTRTSTEVVFVLNQWYHLVVTFDGLNLAMYQYGERVYSGQVSGALSQDAGVTTIGEGLIGTIDSVKLYDKALHPSVIARQLFRPVTSPGSDNLVEYYPLNDIATENPSVVSVQARQFQDQYGELSAYTFNGNSEYINLGQKTFTTVTVVAIVNRIDSALNTDETILSHRTPSRGFSLRLVSGFLHFFVWNTAQGTWNSASDSQALRRGVWNNVAGTFDGRVIKLFVNGTEVAATVTEGGPLEAVAGDLVMGAASSMDRHHWRGIIDEVRVFDVALTAERLNTIGTLYLRRTGCLAALSEQLDDFSAYSMTCPIGERVDYWSMVECTQQPGEYMYEYGCGVGQLQALTTSTRRTTIGCRYARSYDEYLNLYIPSTTSCAPSEETMGWTIVKGDCRDVGMHVVDYKCASKIGADGLMASYGFASGSLADDSGMNVDGVAGSAPLTAVSDAWGNADSALFFNNSHVNIGTEIDMPAFTVMAWVRPIENQANRAYTIISSRSQVDEGFILRMRNGYYEITVNGDRDFFPWMTAASPRPIITNWEHVAATYDGTTLRLFVLGDVEKEFVVYAGQLKMLAEDTHIGARLHTSGAFTDYFMGDIDDVRIYNKALTPAEVKALRGALPQHIVQQGARQITAIRDVYYMCTTAAAETSPPAFCWRKSIFWTCGDPLVECGPLACSYSTGACIAEISDMTAETARGVYTAASMFAGGSAGMSYTMNKVISAGYSTSASMMAGGFEMAKRHWGAMDPAYLPARIVMATNTVKGKMTAAQTALMDDDLVEETCSQAVTRVHYAMKSATSAGGSVPTDLTNALGVSAITTDCGKVASGGASKNQKIACANAALYFASYFDPTGLCAVAAAFLKPEC